VKIILKKTDKSLLLVGLFGSLGNLTTGGFLSGGLFDDTDSNSLSHVTDSETTEWGVLREDFDDH